jgi:hypothetical protein
VAIQRLSDEWKCCLWSSIVEASETTNNRLELIDHIASEIPTDENDKTKKMKRSDKTMKMRESEIRV